MIKTIIHQGEEWKQINCGNCNEVLENHDGHNLMPDELGIENMAMEEGWTKGIEKGTNLCPNCEDEYLEDE